mmetsp:Transcript_7678/g.14155  ORF Transcript_7678/g.14155 Transcript_7678/m.14155 type:complete len:110 (-) Transcript_7678:78-407(-)
MSNLLIFLTNPLDSIKFHYALIYYLGRNFTFHRIIISLRYFTFIVFSFIGGTSPPSHSHLWRHFTFVHNTIIWGGLPPWRVPSLLYYFTCFFCGGGFTPMACFATTIAS